ncbi:MAG: DotH/IcmK family type IV secretion protein, partial [Pseudomonadota bacterium]
SMSSIIGVNYKFVSSLVFVDATGAPWPIVSYSLGDPTRFNIQWEKSNNTLFVQSLATYAHGNVAVTLQNLDTPIMLSLVTAQKEVDYRVDLQVTGRGPNASAAISSGLNKTIDAKLISFLDGIPLEHARKLDVSDRAGEAWLVDKTLYLRTQHTLVSPAWRATVASADGTRVYELGPTPLILLSQDGRTSTVRIGGL